nr:MAG TPA: hypothetical protein [Caudoviricetes sp.]
MITLATLTQSYSNQFGSASVKMESRQKVISK